MTEGPKPVAAYSLRDCQAFHASRLSASRSNRNSRRSAASSIRMPRLPSSASASKPNRQYIRTSFENSPSAAALLSRSYVASSKEIPRWRMAPRPRAEGLIGGGFA